LDQANIKRDGKNFENEWCDDVDAVSICVVKIYFLEKTLTE
jgi:hypothetical protein